MDRPIELLKRRKGRKDGRVRKDVDREEKKKKRQERRQSFFSVIAEAMTRGFTAQMFPVLAASIAAITGAIILFLWRLFGS
jgi:hypothetical protein